MTAAACTSSLAMTTAARILPCNDRHRRCRSDPRATGAPARRSCATMSPRASPRVMLGWRLPGVPLLWRPFRRVPRRAVRGLAWAAVLRRGVLAASGDDVLRRARTHVRQPVGAVLL
eukprot:3664258-Prymnesium_polylepis.1